MEPSGLLSRQVSVRATWMAGRRIVAPLGPVVVALIVMFPQAGHGRNPRRNHMLTQL